MKNEKLITFTILIGVGVLFFFPEPQTNIIAYFGTALFFILVVIFLLKNNKKKK